ncbi:retrovirus-related pol polyprotein from transposon TNT 1-94 [Tanacetum coccineum]
MLTRIIATKLTAASASECLFADFLFEIEPKKVSEELKHPGWIDAMQEKLNQFYRNKVWTHVPLPYGKIAIGSKWVFRNKKDKHGITTKNKEILVTQGYIYQMDVKSAFLNGKLKEEVYVKQPPSFKSSEFPDYVCKLDKALYGLKQAPKACSLVKTPMVPLNNLGPNLAGKPVNETSYRGMIGSLMYLTATRPNIQFSTVLCARYQSYPKESHLTVVKRILRYLKGTSTFSLYYPKYLGFDLKGYSDSDYAGCNMDRKSTSGACQILDGKLVCWSAKKQLSVAMSLAEAKYVVVAGCCAILYSRTKHIDIRYHFIRDHILKGNIELHFIPTEYQLADIFTKPLDEPTFTRLKAELDITVVAFDPFPSTDEPKKCPLKEFLIKFSFLNGQKPLTLDFNTFCSSTDLDYNNGKYVDNPTREALKKELGSIDCIVINPSYLDKTLVLKNSFPMAWRILLTFVIQDPSKVTDIELTAHMIAINNWRDSVSPPHLVAKPKKWKSQTMTSTLPKSQGPVASGALSKKSKRPKSKKPPTKTKRDIQLASTGLPSILDEGTRKSTPFPESTATHPNDSGGNKQPLDRDLTSMTFDEGMAKTTPRLEGSLGDKDSGETCHPLIWNQYTLLLLIPQELLLKPLQLQTFADIQVDLLLTHPEHHEEAAISYADLKASINQYYDENIAHRDQTDKLVEAFMSSLDRSNTTISDLYKGLDVITQLLKDINNTVKDDPAANQKINEATDTFERISSNITEVLSLVKGFDFSALLSTVKDLQAHALKQDEKLAAWAKSSTNMRWTIGSRISGLERAQNHIKSSMSSLQEDTHSIRSMMAEMYASFKGYPFSSPSCSVTPTLALTHIPTNFKGENATNTTTEELLLTLRGRLETQQSTQRIDKGKGIATESDEDPLKRLDKEEKMKKAAEEAKLLAMSRPKVIKVVRKEAKKLKIDPKEAISNKAELNKRRDEEYMWIMTNKIKPEPITDVRIHPNTKPIVASVFRNNDKRNFNVHNPFKFTDFGMTKLDELGPTIQKKKNSFVKDLMISLSKRYERLKEISKELGIQSALPASIPEQASSQTSGRKRKHMELEPEVKVPGLECNRSLPKGVPFVNNMVIEEPEYGIFFTDVFGDHAF